MWQGFIPFLVKRFLIMSATHCETIQPIDFRWSKLDTFFPCWSGLTLIFGVEIIFFTQLSRRVTFSHLHQSSYRVLSSCWYRVGAVVVYYIQLAHAWLVLSVVACLRHEMVRGRLPSNTERIHGTDCCRWERVHRLCTFAFGGRGCQGRQK